MKDEGQRFPILYVLYLFFGIVLASLSISCKVARQDLNQNQLKTASDTPEIEIPEVQYKNVIPYVIILQLSPEDFKALPQTSDSDDPNYRIFSGDLNETPSLALASLLAFQEVLLSRVTRGKKVNIDKAIERSLNTLKMLRENPKNIEIAKNVEAIALLEFTKSTEGDYAVFLPVGTNENYENKIPGKDKKGEYYATHTYHKSVSMNSSVLFSANLNIKSNERLNFVKINELNSLRWEINEKVLEKLNVENNDLGATIKKTLDASFMVSIDDTPEGPLRVESRLSSLIGKVSSYFGNRVVDSLKPQIVRQILMDHFKYQIEKAVVSDPNSQIDKDFIPTLTSIFLEVTQEVKELKNIELVNNFFNEEQLDIEFSTAVQVISGRVEERLLKGLDGERYFYVDKEGQRISIPDRDINAMQNIAQSMKANPTLSQYNDEVPIKFHLYQELQEGKVRSVYFKLKVKPVIENGKQNGWVFLKDNTIKIKDFAIEGARAGFGFVRRNISGFLESLSSKEESIPATAK